MKRENFGSRLGLILVSAGCAIGIGNVWKFPYVCGEYGGAAFILIYLAFLVLLGIPLIIVFICLKGYYDTFQSKGPVMLGCWMTVAVALLAFVFYCALGKKRQ